MDKEMERMWRPVVIANLRHYTEENQEMGYSV
jgi:hypothetical protein